MLKEKEAKGDFIVNSDACLHPLVFSFECISSLSLFSLLSSLFPLPSSHDCLSFLLVVSCSFKSELFCDVSLTCDPRLLLWVMFFRLYSPWFLLFLVAWKQTVFTCILLLLSLMHHEKTCIPRNHPSRHTYISDVMWCSRKIFREYCFTFSSSCVLLPCCSSLVFPGLPLSCNFLVVFYYASLSSTRGT